MKRLLAAYEAEGRRSRAQAIAAISGSESPRARGDQHTRGDTIVAKAC